MKRFEPPAASCTIYTFKEGLLSAVAHDLELRVRRFSVEVSAPGEGPTPLFARLDAGSLRVVTALAHGRPHAALGEADTRNIERTIVAEVLEARRFPEIRYSARAITGQGGHRRIEGTLSLHGRDRALALQAVREGESWRVEATLHQPDFGIKPYSAMLGTLKIKPDVRVVLTLPAEASAVLGGDDGEGGGGEPPSAA